MIILKIIDCSETNCKHCPYNICSECLTKYYLYEDYTCAIECEDIDG